MTDTASLDRLLAGHRHVRLCVLGRPPAGLVLPAFEGFERVAIVATRPADARPGTVLADARRLPFHEALFDRLLVTTALSDARAEMREIWRVMAPAGLALLLVKARRPLWPGDGWREKELRLALVEGMFEVLDWQISALPDRWHLVLVAKQDGWKPVMVGEAQAAPVEALAGG